MNHLPAPTEIALSVIERLVVSSKATGETGQAARSTAVALRTAPIVVPSQFSNGGSSRRLARAESAPGRRRRACATTSFGERQSARAIATRCNCPPDSSCGKRLLKLAGRPTRLKSSPTRSGMSFGGATRWRRSGIASASSMRPRGLNEESGSWKTICMSRRSGRSARSPLVVMSCPPITMRPAFAQTVLDAGVTFSSWRGLRARCGGRLTLIACRARCIAGR